LPPPSPEAQLQWLKKLQRLFSEGEFTATYKFALLIALADLAVERGNDDGEPLHLTFREIAVKFVEPYWQQTAPYVRGTDSAVLLAADSGAEYALYQTANGQALVVSAIKTFQSQHPRLNPNGLRDEGVFRPLLTETPRRSASSPHSSCRTLPVNQTSSSTRSPRMV
jgi:hypothetical protein